MLSFLIHEELRFHADDLASGLQSTVSQFPHEPSPAAAVNEGVPVAGNPSP